MEEQQKNITSCNDVKTNNFIQKAQKVHGYMYSYEFTKYIHSRKYVKILCPICRDKGIFIWSKINGLLQKGDKPGIFLQLPSSHLQNIGCPECGKNKAAKNNKKLTKQFIIEAQKVHKNIDGTPKYSYDLTEYIHSEDKVKIICPIHGVFYQQANSHLQKRGCPECGNNSCTEKITKSTKQFIIEAQEVHKNIDGTPKYSYVLTEYIHSEDKVKIICPIHGVFSQQANSHLQGHGCPECVNNNGKSKLEKEVVEYVKSIYNVPGRFECTENSRDILSSGLELDIYIPKLQLAIEFDGLYWHSEVFKDKNYHLQKTVECESKGIQLIHIFEDEWLNKQKIVKSRLSQLLGVTKFKIPARKCYIKTVDKIEENRFFENNHIQGKVNSSVCYGLYCIDFNKEFLVCAMSFGSKRKVLGSVSEEGVYEMYRFANKINCSVIGGASRLFKHFIKQHKPKEVLSFADRRWSSNVRNKTLYDQLGLKFVGVTPISYFYVERQKRIFRFARRKDILVSKYGCSIKDTEHNFCFNQGWYRIYDCGNLKYVWKNNISYQ